MRWYAADGCVDDDEEEEEEDDEEEEEDVEDEEDEEEEDILDLLSWKWSARSKRGVTYARRRGSEPRTRKKY